jgi:hypothetical protein
MASFPDLRPGFRSAKAGTKAVRPSRLRILLAVSAALLTAFFAVSELATPHGAKAHDASAYLTRELGSLETTVSRSTAEASSSGRTDRRSGFGPRTPALVRGVGTSTVYRGRRRSVWRQSPSADSGRSNHSSSRARKAYAPGAGRSTRPCGRGSAATERSTSLILERIASASSPSHR